MRFAGFVTAFILCLALTACAAQTPQQALIGTWTGTVRASTGSKPAPAHLTVVFRPDRSWSATEKIDGVSDPLSFKGSWALASDGVTFQITRNSGTGMGQEAVIEKGNLVSGPPSSRTVLTKHQWWQLW